MAGHPAPDGRLEFFDVPCCLISNHDHLPMETPEANLAKRIGCVGNWLLFAFGATEQATIAGYRRFIADGIELRRQLTFLSAHHSERIE